MNTRKKHKLLYYGAVTLFSAITFSTVSSASPVSADSTTTSPVANDSVLVHSFATVPTGSGGQTNGRWKYMYTAEPYAFFYNSAIDEWKMVQVTSYTKHTVTVMVGGWSDTINRWAKGYYLP